MRFVYECILLWRSVGRNRISNSTRATESSTVDLHEYRLTRLTFAACFCAVIAAGRWCASAENDTGMVDLSKVIVVTPSDLSTQEKKAVSLLIDEVERRTQIRWSVSPTWPKTGTTPVIAVGRATNLLRDFPTPANWLTNDPPLAGAEGYRIHSADGKLPIFVVGNDSRGVLYGVGRLLRELRMGRNRVTVPAGFSEKSVPQISLRGHQLGYRAKRTPTMDGIFGNGNSTTAIWWSSVPMRLN